MTFQNASLVQGVVIIGHINTLAGLDVNDSIHSCKCGLVLFHTASSYIRNGQSHGHSLYRMMSACSCVICTSNKVEYLEKEGSCKNSTQSNQQIISQNYVL